MNELTLLKFNEHDIRMIQDENGEPWWIAKDICFILGIVNTTQALEKLDDDEKGIYKTYTLGGEQEMLIINESGLYSLILRSNKPEANKLRRWINP